MSNTSSINEICNKVDRLLLRYEELQRTNALLQQEVHALTRERDDLNSRMDTARARIDALLLRIPEPAKPTKV